MPREHSSLCYCSVGKVSAPCHFLWTGQHLDEDDIGATQALIGGIFARAFGQKCAGCATEGKTTVVGKEQAARTKQALNMKLCTRCERIALDHIERKRREAKERYDAKASPA